jgi:hypothetical protein
MASSTLPTKPVENWEQVRDEWVAAVESVVRDAEAWSKNQGWATRLDPKTIREDRLGEYTVPRLLIHTLDGRLLLVPVARYVGGADGRIDLFLMPSYDSVPITRTAGGWSIHPTGDADDSRPWSEATFVETAQRLVAAG